MSSRGVRNHQLGQWGEKLAAEYLRKKGYSLLNSRWRCRFGEIDLIVQNQEFLVFVEVKLRKNSSIASAREFVDFRKQEKVRTSAGLYLSWHPTSRQPRFDVMEVYAPQGIDTKMPKLIHIENAFE